MDKIIMKFKNDILFIKPQGDIMKTDINDFNYKIIPIVIKLDINNVVINMESVNRIHSTIIDVFSSLNYLIRKGNGKLVICGLKKTYKKMFNKLNDEFVFNAPDEITSMEVLKV